MRVGIVNISLGNVGSVMSAFGFYEADVTLVDDAAGLAGVDLLVLAGVGNFQSASGKVAALKDALSHEVLVKKKPVLGICLGMHLFADVGLEDGENPGLGWIGGKVVKIEGEKLRVPHMGWNEVVPRREVLFEGMRSRQFYFMHSYRIVPDDPSVIAATTQYGDVEIVSAVQQGNIYGVQFHPEKSQGDGLRFLRNLIKEIQ